MHKATNYFFILILSAGLFISCSDSTTGVNNNTGGNDNNNSNEQQNESTTGTVAVQVSTDGSDVDSDGYTMVLDNSDQENAAIEDTVYFSDIEEGSHNVELTKAADNCSVEGDNPKTLDVTTDDTTTVTFVVGCDALGPAALVNTIAYESSGQGGGYSKIYVMAEDGSNPVMLYEAESGNALQPNISPDGKQILFSAGSFDNYLYVMDSDGSNVEQLTTDEDDADDYNPVWSPDGSKIAFERDQDIFVMNADGSGQENLTQSPNYFEVDPAWSPDGQKIVFARGENDSYSQDEGNLFVVNSDGSGLTGLTETAADIDREPVWSPDGTQIAFARRPDGDVSEVFVMDANGDNITQITQLPSDATEYSSRAPVWAPDGSRIAYTGQRDTGTFIHIINTDDSNEAILDNGTVNHGNADWSPVQE